MSRCPALGREQLQDLLQDLCPTQGSAWSSKYLHPGTLDMGRAPDTPSPRMAIVHQPQCSPAPHPRNPAKSHSGLPAPPSRGGGAWAAMSPAHRLCLTGHAGDTRQPCSDRARLMGRWGRPANSPALPSEDRGPIKPVRLPELNAASHGSRHLASSELSLLPTPRIGNKKEI